MHCRIPSHIFHVPSKACATLGFTYQKACFRVALFRCRKMSFRCRVFSFRYQELSFRHRVASFRHREIGFPYRNVAFAHRKNDCRTSLRASLYQIAMKGVVLPILWLIRCKAVVKRFYTSLSTEFCSVRGSERTRAYMERT